MQMTRAEARKRFPDRPEPVPAALAGQWVAWSADRDRIVAHGPRFDDVHATALAAGCTEPLMQHIGATPFVGGA